MTAPERELWRYSCCGSFGAGTSHVPELDAHGGLDVNVGVLGDAQRLELLTQGHEPQCKLGHVGAVQAVDAVGPQHPDLQLAAERHQETAAGMHHSGCNQQHRHHHHQAILFQL